MILIYTPKTSSRLHYAVKLVINQICGFDYTVTTSGEEFLNFKGARINYSDKEFPFESMNIIPSGFLLLKGIKNITPQVLNIQPAPVLFPNAPESGCDLGFDIFSAAFYLTSRYEEYLPFIEDRYGRFEADQSMAFRHGFLEKPVVDIYAQQLVKELKLRFPFIENPVKRSSFIPTYDIDIAYAYKGKGISRNILAILKDIMGFNFANLKNRILVLTGKMKDPFDTYTFQLNLQKKYNLKPIYFFLAAEYGPFDRNISTTTKNFEVLLKTLGDYADTGIHPSFASNTKEARLDREIKIISRTLNKPVENSRQHFLKLYFPATYQSLIKYNIYRDYSMGYASYPGFRAGTCTPFYFYNLSSETETRLKIFPITVMDGTLRDYLNLNPSEALNRIKNLIDQVHKVNGTFISLWHNESLCECNQWIGWRKVYASMIEYAVKKLQK
jgi:hypothetical protein